MHRLLLVSLVGLPLFTWGQANLVPNPGFEEHSDCPFNSAEIYFAVPWNNSGTECSPDYYNECGLPLIFPPDTFPNLGVPENGQGFQFAHSGVGYAGFYAVSDPVLYPNFREYLQVELIEPILPSVRYRVQFFVSPAEKFWYGVGSLGAYFSSTHIYRNNPDYLQVEPHIQSPAGVTYLDRENWTAVVDTFVSRDGGGERYLLIGNFKPDSLSQLTFIDSGYTNTSNRAYYYIDDVSVVALDTVSAVAEHEKLQVRVWPNPTTGLITYTGTGPLSTANVMDLTGRTLQTMALNGTTTATIDLSPYHPGTFLLRMQYKTGKAETHRVVRQ